MLVGKKLKIWEINRLRSKEECCPKMLKEWSIPIYIVMLAYNKQDIVLYEQCETVYAKHICNKR